MHNKALRLLLIVSQLMALLGCSQQQALKPPSNSISNQHFVEDQIKAMKLLDYKDTKCEPLDESQLASMVNIKGFYIGMHRCEVASKLKRDNLLYSLYSYNDSTIIEQGSFTIAGINRYENDYPTSIILIINYQVSYFSLIRCNSIKCIIPLNLNTLI
ncbi:hypothetical protein [Methylomicrobium sp. Wu6]|uniref:hypothetical protein n=1 Tax=Methylomicrobium sp. Wu6 TaxID=3107928 RepID=UPI002DD6995B|nr:hypothetical protein [Methylomicrobium sp. Wu6]MEC4747728.1 hypothetical protein [Methylomicrobium sp. Wu6]